MEDKFDIEAALAGLKSGQDLMGKDGVLTPLIKQLTEAALQGELESHLSQDDKVDDRANRKNGYSKKTRLFNILCQVRLIYRDFCPTLCQNI